MLKAVINKELRAKSQVEIAQQCEEHGLRVSHSKDEMITRLLPVLAAGRSKYNNDIVEQLLQLQIANRAQIWAAMDKVVNRNDINEVSQYILDHPPIKITSATQWPDDDGKYAYEGQSEQKYNSLPPTKNKTSNSSKYQPLLSSPYENSMPQNLQHQFVVEYWARTACAMKADDIAEILLEIITSYSLPSFRFRYGNEKLIGIYKDGLVCHQMQKKQCSALFGPRMKYDGLDKNMVYKFKFLMKSGNVSLGVCADDYVKWNALLHDVNTLRHAVIWKNGFYHHNSDGTRSNTAIRSGHVADIYNDGDLVELEVNLSTLKCFVRNLSDLKMKPTELPIAPLVNFKGASNYLQIVIGFFDDFGTHSWVQGAGVIEVVEQRGEYHTGAFGQY